MKPVGNENLKFRQVADGKAYWRSLDELANTPEFRDWVDRRFPQSIRELLAGGVDRRQFLHLMAASLGLAGLAGCQRPSALVLPYAKVPEDVSPGLPTFYATAMPRPGSANPILVESHEGRPTKVEGNPGHPASLGTSDAQTQASILDLYDPDRAMPVLQRGEPSSWQAYDSFALDHFAALKRKRGRGLAVLSGDIASPTLDRLREQFARDFPEARWHVFEPFSLEHMQVGAQLALGAAYACRFRLDKAGVILTLDCDLLGLEEDGGRHLGEYAEARRRLTPDAMNRLYTVESSLSVTGAAADHRLRIPASQIESYTRVLARRLLGGEPKAARLYQALNAAAAAKFEVPAPWIEEVARDLEAHRGQGLIVAGRRQPPLVHALVYALNETLGNLGKAVELRDFPRLPAANLEPLRDAAAAGKVDTLVILGGNPVYSAPLDLKLAELLPRIATTIRLGMHVDETSVLCTWHLPEAHYLETWGDARTSDGTITPIQPLIEPLFGGRSAVELIARMLGLEATSVYEIVRQTFRARLGVKDPDFELAWRRYLHEGLLAGSAVGLAKHDVRWQAIAAAVATAPPPVQPPSADRLELVFDRDYRLDDGRFANNGWLQELPDPITKLTWGNAALLSPATARALQVENGDVVRLELAGRTLEIPALIVPGQADHSISLALGHGRTHVGRVGRGVGVDAKMLRSAAAPYLAVGATLTRTGRKQTIACTQDHFRMESRDLVREEQVTELGVSRRAGSEVAAGESAQQLITPPAFDGEHQWGMVIDLNSCVGCNACVVACQSENNIPIVGRDQVIRGREMHWIRLDRYFSGDEESPGVVHQPVACMQCDNAPCEVVCPVNATVHSNEGLNVQVYSRCIGTRYCMNNCPYKVRRFNYYNYNERPLDQLWLGPMAAYGMAEPLKLQKNPDVTVRIRGVMEKCTYCLQRIERAKIGARVAAGESGHTAVADGTITPACAQACPARAIVFGDLSDPESRVAKARASPRNYALLGELNTGPRTTYQSRVRNPNPRMQETGARA